ncbi:uncharacterized protein HMPREF1541_05377 [Cyphellophora europaea CBS 101466]|uniref:Uncharacterized protein n=1 Tax=Cyphellophora europaea (strain CBS 101466) TaxID=1220924 RepID=W2RTV5_CYPE1|nr:uncharacterized protein HMPREF1541_05377 [Cyphellophora europaea CBS 101466]ETN39154.1 hypothetical protein HMPREF1541_05377 [Cyphellophora europaea CBS 101466]
MPPPQFGSLPHISRDPSLMTFQPRPYPPPGPAPYMQNGSGPVPGARPLLPDNGRVIQSGPTRVLCIADVRGNLQSLNDLAKTANADYILHTGDFGFYDNTSLERIADKTLKHVAQYSPLISDHVKRQINQPPQGQPAKSIKSMFSQDQLPLSQLPLLLNKSITLDVPVYTVWGACEDVRVLERFRSGEYKVDNLHIIDEVNSRLLEIGGVKLRLLGLGGAVVIHKLFDNGEGKTYIAGGQGTMWTTLLQIGALIDTANRVYDPSETRIFLTHASPARDGILNQLSVTLKADFSISAGLHFRYGSSYNEFSVNPSLDHYRGKLAASKASFNDVWETVRADVEQAIETNPSHKLLLSQALEIIEKMPATANGGNPFGGPVGGNPAAGQVDESAFKNMWNFNLADAAFGYLVLEVDGGRIGTEMRAQGFNFAHRSGKPTHSLPQQAAPVAPVTAPQGPPTGPAQGRPAFTAPPQPFPQPPRPQQQQHRNTAGPGGKASTPPTAASPAPPVTQAKPMTPQPSTTAVPTTSTPANTNGTAEKGDDKKPASPAAVDRKQSTALYLSHADSEAAAREYIPDPHKEKIKSLMSWGKFHSAWKINFDTNEDAAAALKAGQDEIQNKRKDGTAKLPSLSFFMDKSDRFHRDTPSTGAGFRGTSQAASAGSTPRGGHQSGAASDSDGGNRGRSSFRGGRGRGRGDDRGGRGGRGRGGFPNKGDSDSKPVESKPAEAKSGDAA